MENLYLKNLETIKKKYPNLAEKIENRKIENNSEYVLEIDKKTNMPNIYSRCLGKKIYSPNIMLDVKNYFNDIKFEENIDLVVFDGLSLGYEILFFGMNMSEKLGIKRVIIIEQNLDIFKEAMNYIDFTILIENNNLSIIFGLDKEKTLENLKKIIDEESRKYQLKNIKVLKTNTNYNNNDEIYELIEEEIEKFNRKKRFNSNMELLKQYNNALFEKLKNYIPEGNYKLENTGELKTPNIYIERLNKYYYDEFNPIKDAANQVDILKLKNTKIALVLGIGLGYELQYFRKEFAEKNNTIGMIIVEKELEIFYLAMHITNFKEFIEKDKILFLIETSKESIFQEIHSFMDKNQGLMIASKAIKAVYHYSSLELNKEYYIEIIRNMKEVAKYQIAKFGNSVEDNFWGIEHILENLDIIIKTPGINLLFDKFKGKPAIAVGSGPTLAKNIEYLKNMEDKVLIICAESTMRPLIENGIKPHMVAVSERTIGVVTSFDKLKEEDFEKTYLVSCPVVENEVYNVYKGKNIMVYRDYAHFRWIGIDRGILPIKQSTGIMAFELAISMGCSPIILLGQDCAYEEGTTITHSIELGGGLEGRKHEQYTRSYKDVMVKGNNGRQILSNEAWYELIKGFEIDLKSYNGICINNDSGGAYINGTKVMNFKEAMDKYAKENIYPLQIIEKNLKSFDKSKIEKDCQKIKNIIKKTIDDIEEMDHKTKIGMENYEKIEFRLNKYWEQRNNLNNTERDNILELKHRILKDKNIVGGRTETFQLYIAHIAQSFLINFEMKMVGIYDEYEDEIIAELRILIYQKEWFLVMKKIMERSLEKLKYEYEKLVREKEC